MVAPSPPLARRLRGVRRRRGAAIRKVVPGGMLPSVWTGVSLLASGATALNVKGLWLADTTGQPVMTIGAVESTPFSSGQPLPIDALFRVEWTAVPLSTVEQAIDMVTVATRDDVVASDAEVLVYEAIDADPRTAVNAALDVLKAWLAEPALAETRLAVVTGDCAELGAAAVWGLVRSAQSEHPGRIV